MAATHVPIFRNVAAGYCPEETFVPGRVMHHGTTQVAACDLRMLRLYYRILESLRFREQMGVGYPICKRLHYLA